MSKAFIVLETEPVKHMLQELLEKYSLRQSYNLNNLVFLMVKELVMSRSSFLIEDHEPLYASVLFNTEIWNITEEQLNVYRTMALDPIWNSAKYELGLQLDKHIGYGSYAEWVIFFLQGTIAIVEKELYANQSTANVTKDQIGLINESGYAIIAIDCKPVLSYLLIAFQQAYGIQLFYNTLSKMYIDVILNMYPMLEMEREEEPDIGIDIQVEKEFKQNIIRTAIETLCHPEFVSKLEVTKKYLLELDQNNILAIYPKN